MDEDLKRVIEDLPVVNSVRFHTGDKTHKQASMSTSGVLQRLRMEDVARSWWGPSASRANVPLLLTAYVNLDD